VGPATTTTLRDTARQYSGAQRRVIAAALDLFGDHGVGGTSLQMIADHLGVTKAAVYHQFKTKEAIVVAVATTELVGLEAALEAAEAADSDQAAREALLHKLIGLAVQQRRAVATLQNDPVIVRFLTENQPFQGMWARLYAALLGDDLVLDASTLVQVALLSAAIAGAVGHPFVRHLDDATLEAELLAIARKLVFTAD
jgi:AcrR family transcriptional regulator